MMESKLAENIKKEYKQIKAPESLYDFANQVPNLVESITVNTPPNRNKRFRKSINASVTAVACSALFVFGVNQSTTFANYVDKIPILSQMSEFLRFDRGIEKAVEHGYLQEVAKSSEDQGITFTIDNVIADSKRMFVFYHIDLNKTEIDEVSMINFNFADEQNKTLFSMKDRFLNWPEEAKFLPRHISSLSKDEGANSTKLTGWMELVSADQTASIPKEIKISIHSFVATKSNKIEAILGEWNVSFQIDSNNIHSKPIEYKGKEFPIKVGARELDLIINYTKVYPTMTEMSMDLQNELKESIFYGYHLENESGKIYKHIEDGILTDTGDVLPQFESSFFDQPEKLFLVMDKISIVSPDGIEQTFNVNKKIELTN